MRVKFIDMEYIRNTAPPRLRFRFTITNDGGLPSTYFNFMGDVSFFLENEDSEFVGDDSLLLGNLIDTNRRIYEIKPAMTDDISLDFLLTPLIKNVIEENRDGNFQLKLYLRCHKFEYHPTGKIPKFSGDEGWVFNPGGSTGIEIPRSKWTDILSKAGYDKFQLIEIPIDYQEIIGSTGSIQDIGLGSRLQKATEQLTLILRHMAEGDWAKAVADCRVALEAFTKGTITIEGKSESAKTAINKIMLSSGLPEKNVQSFNEMVERLKDFSSTQHHIKSNSAEDIELPALMNREDALFMVTATATIINLLSRKYRRQTNL